MFPSQNFSSAITSSPRISFLYHENLDYVKVYMLLVMSLEMGPKAGSMEMIFPAILAMKFASHFYMFKALLSKLNHFSIFFEGTPNSIFVVSMLKPKNLPFLRRNPNGFFSI